MPKISRVAHTMAPVYNAMNSIVSKRYKRPRLTDSFGRNAFRSRSSSKTAPPSAISRIIKKIAVRISG